jgi:CSLREA domain-containing protein
MIFRSRVALTLLAALFLLASPSAASAVVFTVDSTGDEADKTLDGTCETNTPGECTLRAAIQESNASAAVKDDILFDLSVFDGQIADTIAPATVLPPLSSPVALNAGTCLTAAGVNGPCAGVNGPSGEVGLEVTADGSSISGLSLTGLSFGIVIGSSSSNVTLQGNWIGVKLDGTAGGNSNFGIFVDPNSDGATIGGTEVVQRNVVANTTGTGLDLEGASEATIQGNYFGVGVDGETPMSNGKNIEITGRLGFIPSEDVEAEDNEIGATVAGAAATSAVCDGGCNVISGALGTGVDLNGNALQSEKPAIGPTLVHGNYVGLDATGTGVVANGGFAAIWAGGADDVTVGGTAAGDANYLAGGSEGIVSENGNGFKALGNVIGFGSDGSDQTPPAENGIFALNQSVSEDSEIENNLIRMIGGVAIESVSLTGRIIGNEIQGGNRGIVAGFGDGGGLIAANEVDASEEFGILIQSPKNDVRENTVTNSNGPGIAVKPPPGVTATIGNLIGGSSTGSENVIDGSAGGAIQVVEEAGEPGSWTEITRNRGTSNGGLFIDLVTGANQGILPPVIASATQTKAEGTSKPNATIRIFRKATAASGEVESFLAETEADGTGAWSVAYGSIPAGTNLGATQTVTESGTSELALTTAAADPSTGGGGSSGGGGNHGGGSTPDTTAPKVTITKAPKAKSASTTAKFKFKSNEAGSKFQCKLDKGKFKNCRSPKTYKKLKPGKHLFKVRATDKAGNVSKPAKRKFTVLG